MCSMEIKTVAILVLSSPNRILRDAAGSQLNKPRLQR